MRIVNPDNRKPAPPAELDTALIMRTDDATLIGYSLTEEPIKIPHDAPRNAINSALRALANELNRKDS